MTTPIIQPPKSDTPCHLSEQRFLDLIEIATSWYWEMDAQLRFSWIDPRARQVVDRPDEEILGHTRPEIYAREIENDPERWRPHLDDLNAHRPFRNFQFSFLCDDGKTCWLSISAKPIVDKDGDFLGYRGITQDITEQKDLELALRASEQRFRDFADTAADGFWEQDEHFRFTQYSKPLPDTSGLTCDAIQGKTRQELFPKEIAAYPTLWQANFDDLAAHRPFDSFVSPYWRPDGEVVYIQLNGKPIYDRDDRFRGYRGVSLDVTEKIRAQQAQRLHEQRLSDIAELASDWMWEQDEHLRFSFCSIAQQPYGVTPDQLYGKQRREFWQQVNQIHEAALWDQHDAALQAHRPIKDFVVPWLTPDGHRRFISINGKPLFNAAGKFVGYRGFNRDVTELIEHTRRFQALVEGSIEGIYIQRDWQLLFVNQSLADMLGYPSTQALLKVGTLDAVYPPAEQRRLKGYWQARLAGDQTPRHYETQAVHKKGHLIDIEVLANCVTWDSQDWAVQATIIDITAKKKAERALLESEQAYSQQLLDLSEEERLRVANELHDGVKLGLAAIKNQVGALVKSINSSLTPESKALTEAIYRAVNGSIHEMDHIVMDLRPPVLDQGIRQAVRWWIDERFQPVYPNMAVRLTARLHRPLPTALTLVIYRIVQEALTNAARHSNADHITINLKASQHTLMLTITDNGEGFDERRLSQHQRRGLGLTSMRRRASFSGGELKIRHAKQKHGTRIHATWPATFILDAIRPDRHQRQTPPNHHNRSAGAILSADNQSAVSTVP